MLKNTEQHKILLNTRKEYLVQMKYFAGEYNSYSNMNKEYCEQVIKSLGSLSFLAKSNLDNNNKLPPILLEGFEYLGLDKDEQQSIKDEYRGYLLSTINHNIDLLNLRLNYEVNKYGVKKENHTTSFVGDNTKLDKAKAYPMSNLLKINNAGFANCPYHNEKSASCKYYPAKNKCHCFGCQKTFDVIDLYCHLNNVEFKDALETLTL